MANIKPYDTAAGKRYRVRYRKPDGQQTQKRGFKTKKEAETYAASVVVSKATGEYIDPALGRILVDQLAGGYLKGKQSTLKPSAYRPLESAWRTHVEPEWGAREVKSIQPSEVQIWIGKMHAHRSATTVKRAHGVLVGILDLAVNDRRLPRNPASGAKTPKKKPKARIYLSHDQVQEFATESTHPALVLTLAYTGLRWGEATALRVRHVNQLRRRLMVEENAVLAGAVLHVGTPKAHRKRVVPYPVFLGKLLAVEMEGKRPGDLLFGDGQLHMILPNSVTGWFAGAVGRCQSKRELAIEEAKERGERLRSTSSLGSLLMTSATLLRHSQ